MRQNYFYSINLYFTGMLGIYVFNFVFVFVFVYVIFLFFIFFFVSCQVEIKDLPEITTQALVRVRDKGTH